MNSVHYIFDRYKAMRARWRCAFHPLLGSTQHPEGGSEELMEKGLPVEFGQPTDLPAGQCDAGFVITHSRGLHADVTITQISSRYGQSGQSNDST